MNKIIDTSRSAIPNAVFPNIINITERTSEIAGKVVAITRKLKFMSVL
jgi:hypothetical protein